MTNTANIKLNGDSFKAFLEIKYKKKAAHFPYSYSTQYVPSQISQVS